VLDKHGVTDSLDELTLVIPTLGREKFVDRQIGILGDCGVRVILVDGGRVGRTTEWVRGLPPTFSYYSLPGESLPTRMRFASSLVISPFVATLADDDIFLPSALSRLVKELIVKPEASSAMGRTYRFHVADGEFRGARRYDFDEEFPVRESWQSVTTYVTENFTRQYNYYAVFRREVWKRNIKVAYQIEYSCPYVSEVAVRLLGVLQGNGAMVSVLWWLRSDESEPVSTRGWERKVGLFEWFHDEESRIEREWLVRTIAEEGVEQGWWSAGDAREVVSTIIGECIRTTNTTQSSPMNVLLAALARSAQVLPASLKKGLKRFLSVRRARQLGVGLRFSVIKNELRESGIQFDEMEFDHIVQIVLTFNTAVGVR
jgi:glycosyltransferase domain-containing protein